MQTVMVALIGVCLAAGIFFAAVGVIGVLMFPDFFARAQAATCITTMGTLGAVISGILYCAANGLPPVWYVKLLLIAAMLFLSSAVSGHALSKGTYRRGHRPRTGGLYGFEKDDYKEVDFGEH